MKRIYPVLFTILIITASCGGNNDKDMAPEEMIAGTSSKIWKAEREYDASGDKVDMTDEEADETMRFYADGNFSIQAASEMASGTWSYDGATNSLSMVFDGEDVSENFSVTQLSTDEITLVAGDGSKLVLTTD